MSTGVPSGKYGISSSGSTLATTPLFPCLPAILSPSVILLVCATQTRTSLFTPGDRSSPLSLSSTFTSITFPPWPYGIYSDESFTSLAFSPKIARNNFSSALSSDSPFGVIFPTNMSLLLTSAPILITPSSSRFRRLSSPMLGMSLVISSGPSFVSRASTSCFSICIEVNLSSLVSLLLNMIASSKL